MGTNASTSIAPIDTPMATLQHADLVDRARSFAIASRAPATLSAYASDFRHFSGWAERLGLASLPADPGTVALYVTDMAAEFKPSTITRRLSAISVAHQHAGHASPTQDASVRSVLNGIRRSLGTAPKQVAPATIGELRRMVARMGTSTLDLRDRALLLLGFATASRRSELVALNVEDLVPVEHGLLVMVRRGKTDQSGSGETKAVPRGSDPETCPVRAVQAWLAGAEITEGPVFRPVSRGGSVSTERLSGKGVAIIVKRAAERAGLDPRSYSGHSLRAGFVTTAAANGATERAISRQTGHAPASATLRRYVRHASAFVDNAVSMVGL